MEKKSYRTTLPFTDGLSGLTDKSKACPLFGDTPSIEEIVMVERRRDRLNDNDIHSRGNWAPGEDKEGKSYKEEGREYMLPQEIEQILKRMQQNGQMPAGEAWVAVDEKDKPIIFPSQEIATREIREKKLNIKRLIRIPPKTAQADFISLVIPSCVKIEAVSADGNGEVGAAFCVAPGVFATCSHCIKKYDKLGKKEAEDATITLSRGEEVVPAEILHFDADKDLAFVKSAMDAEPLPLADEADIQQGEEVVVVGSPMGFENNVSSGMISSTSRVIFDFPDAPTYIFTDANVLPGNSGGPMLLKKNGKVAGMMCIIISQEGFYGLNAALPASHIKNGLSSIGIEPRH